MAHSKKVWKVSGKRASLLVPISIFVAIATLIGLIAIVLIKANTFDRSLGDRQLELFTVYQTGEKYMHFVDAAAGIAVKPALLKVAETGLKKNLKCPRYSGDGNDYTLWASQSLDADSACELKSVPCYPDDAEAKDYLAESFSPGFGAIIDEYNANKEIPGVFSANILKEYEKFYVGGGVKPTIVGVAKGQIVLEKLRITANNAPVIVIQYKLNLSFTEPVDVNFLQDSANLVGVAKQLIGKPKDEVTELVKAADGQNSLDWDENFDYSKAESACAHSVGICSCCKTVQNPDDCSGKDGNGNPICKPVPPSEVPVGDGVLKEKVPYDIFNVPMSVKVNDHESGTGHRQFFVYDEAERKVVPKELEYRFALSWIEAHPEDAIPFCSCGEGHPCIV